MKIVKKTTGKNDSLDKILESQKFKNFSVVKMEQVHGSNFIEISDKNFPPESKTITIPKVDAVITTKKNILLSVKTADCLPILIHWENKNNEQGIAAIHSGRAGTEKKILTKVLLHLKKKYGVGEGNNSTNKNITQHEQITIWLGPAICKKCYQINEETDLHYDLYQKNIDQIEAVFPNRNGQNLPFDLKIIRSEHCTLHDNNLFYSYRKTGKGVLMNYSLIGLTDN